MDRTYRRKGNGRTELLLILFLVLSFFMVVFNILLGYPSAWNNVIAVLSLLVSAYLCYIYRHSIGLFLVMMFITYTNYSVAVGVYLDPSIRPSFMYDQFYMSSTYGIGITCIYIFELATLWMSRRWIRGKRSISVWKNAWSEKCEYNNIIAIFSPIVYMALFVLTFTLGEGGARGGSSALGEYRTVIAIIGCYYCGRRKLYKFIWTFIIAITSILVLFSGNRVDMFASAIFLIVFWYADSFDYKKVLFFLPGAVIILAAVGFLRGLFSLGNLDVGSVISVLLEGKLTYEGALYGYVPSLAIVELAEVTGGSEKLNMLWEHIKYIFMFGGANPDLSTWSRDYYIHYWGFVSPTYFYFWIGYLGPVLYACLVNFYNAFYQKCVTRKLRGFKEKLGYILSLFFITTVARWYAYGPMALLRGMFICGVVFCIVYAFDAMTRITYGKGRKTA